MNWWMRVLQTLALPLGHVTIFGATAAAPFGAADEARTRYLHLGKVALYQMSYGRIFGAFYLAPIISDALKTSFKVGESLRFLGGDPDRARTDDPQRDMLVLYPTELPGHIGATVAAPLWSGRRGSNSLPPPWQGGALPDELRPHIGNPAGFP